MWLEDRSPHHWCRPPPHGPPLYSCGPCWVIWEHWSCQDNSCPWEHCFWIFGYPWPVCAIYAVLIGPLEILVASILMYGAMRRNSNALVPYLVFIPLDVIIDWIILGLQLYPADLLYTVLYMILLTIIYLYFWICIFSFWNVLKKAFVHVEIHVAP